MTRRYITFLFLMLLVAATLGYAQKNPPATKKPKRTSFTERVLRFLGISDSSGTLKGPGDEIVSGELWLADLQAKTTHALSAGAGYRSPIFLTSDKDVLALRGSEVVRFSGVGKEGKKLYSVDGVLKLVGASSEDAATVLILMRAEAGGHPRVGELAVSTGKVTLVPYDPASGEDLQMVETLSAWSRTYGDRHIYVQKQTKEGFGGKVEWHDVFLQVEGQPPVDVSQCDGVNCGQPSVSADGRWLVFVKAGAE